MVLMKNDLVVMDNNLIRASYKLTANEMRLILVALSQMPKDPNEPIDPKQAYYICKDDFVRLGLSRIMSLERLEKPVVTC